MTLTGPVIKRVDPENHHKEGFIFRYCHIVFTGVILLCAAVFFSGCSSGPGFHVKDLAKSDINQVSEIHMNQAVDLLKNLTQKLYKKNPYELTKSKGQTISSRIEQIFRCPVNPAVKEAGYKQSTEAILLAFEPGFKGDRVFVMMYGLYTMIHRSYNSKCELFMLDYLNEQNLYNSARNIEILVWRLNTRKTRDGKLFLLTNSMDGDVKNLSYERVFGKLIAIQDTMALIVSKRSGRFIKEAVHMAGMAFFPI